jgi:hypothetical protein
MVESLQDKCISVLFSNLYYLPSLESLSSHLADKLFKLIRGMKSEENEAPAFLKKLRLASSLGLRISALKVPKLSNVTYTWFPVISSFRSLTKLTLDFGKSRAHKTKTLSKLAKLSNLVELNLSCSSINVEDLQLLISVYSNLRRLSLAGCRNLKSVPKFTKRTSLKLRSLDLHDTNVKFTMSNWKSLRVLRNLKELNLNGLKWSWDTYLTSDLRLSHHFPELYRLGLESHQLSECIVNDFENLKITHLDLSGTNIDALLMVTKFPRPLQELILRNTDIEEIPKSIETLNIALVDLSFSKVKERPKLSCKYKLLLNHLE